MRYVVESIYRSENIITIYYKNNIKDANNWAHFLQERFHVDTEIYTENEYMKLHPENNFIL